MRKIILCEKRGHLEGTLISVLNKNVSKLFVNFQANFASESPKKWFSKHFWSYVLD